MKEAKADKPEFRVHNKDVVVHIPIPENEANAKQLSEDDYWEQFATQTLDDVEPDSSNSDE